MTRRRCQGNTVLRLTATTTTTVLDCDDWDNEVEVSKTDFGLEKAVSISRLNIRTSATGRNLRKKVRAKETLQQEQDRTLDKDIRESDGVPGYDRLHGHSASLQEVAKTSAGISG